MPPNQPEIRAKVIAVATHAIVACAPRRHPHCVHPEPLRNAFTDFGVAFHTLELLNFEFQFVAIGAMERSGQGLVWLRKRAW